MSLPLTNAKKQYQDQNGNPLAGGSVAYYIPGTLTPVNTYQDQALTIPNSNPVILDANGQAVAWISDATSVREIVKDSIGNQIWDQVTAVGYGSNLSSSNGSSLVGFIQQGANAVNRTIHDKIIEISVSPEDYGSHHDGVTDDSAAFNACITYLKSVNGGSIKLGPYTYAIASTILIDGSNIVIEGRGPDSFHDAGSGSSPCTIVKWIGGSGGTMFSFATPNSTSAAMRTFPGLKRVRLDGNSAAATGVSITSIRSGQFEDISVLNVTSQAFYVTAYVRSGMAEATDTQRCNFIRCNWRLIDTAAVQNAHGMVLTSAAPGTAGANTSFNLFSACGGQTYNGASFYLGDADNNTFVSCNGYVVGSGPVAYTIICDGAYSNYFYGHSGTVRIRGVASGVWANTTSNCFFNVDEANGSQYPTIDISCAVQWHGSIYGYQKPTMAGVSIAQTPSNAVAQQANIGTNSLIVHNASQGGILQTNGTSTYSWSMDGSNNYRLLSSSTIALLDLTQGNSVSLKMNKVGFNGTVPIAAPTPTGVTAGFTAGTGTTVVSGSTFTGNTGSTAYTIGDVVNVLKQYGMLKA